jgi:hypothetical protein
MVAALFFRPKSLIWHQVMHARSGGDIEVMGMLQGKIEANTFIVTDSFPLPVEATETRVNAGALYVSSTFY